MQVQVIWQTLENWRRQNGFLRRHLEEGIMPDAEARELLMRQEIHPVLRGCLDIDPDWQVTGIRGTNDAAMLVVGLPQAEGYPP